MSAYPRLCINTQKLVNNINVILDLCNANGISVTGVVKGFNGIIELVRLFDESGCVHIGDSRLDRLKAFKQAGIKKPLMLLRIPMPSEAREVALFSDISLNSEYTTIEKINAFCKLENKTHNVVLMIDLGDLREGYMDETEILEVANKIVTELDHITLLGLGTNLGCYGAIKPSHKNMSKLISLAHKIEELTGQPMELISGGATTTLPLLIDGEIPKGINNLRIGEEILLGRDLNDIWNRKFHGIQMDAFILEAEIIESRTKPTHPIGELFIDAFGNKPVFEDNGCRKKALTAVGKLDFGLPGFLIPKLDGIKILGASSDHLILDIEDCKVDLHSGDILQFELFYGAVLYLTSSETVKKAIL